MGISKKTPYTYSVFDVENGNKLVAQDLTTSELRDFMGNQHIEPYHYAKRGYKYLKRYVFQITGQKNVNFAFIPPEFEKEIDAKRELSELDKLLAEWDKTTKFFQNHVEWVKHGGIDLRERMVCNGL